MNYCDYDNLFTYPSGSFSSQYKTDITGCIEEAEEKVSFDKTTTESFLNSEYCTYKTTKEIILYRVFGSFKKDVANKEESPQGARINGGFASTEFAESIIDAKIRLALDPVWKNLRLYEVKILVPIGKEISVGKVAPVTLKSDTVLDGLADQVILPQDWPVSWVIGIRRVTARQLQKVPEYYKVENSDELITQFGCMNKKELYKKACPVCGCEEVEVLPVESQFDIVGCKGNTYRMRYHCTRGTCEYYW